MNPLVKLYNGLSHEERRTLDQAYKTFILSKPCLVSGKRPVHAHHLRSQSFSQFGLAVGVGLKPPDILCVPLHWDYHTGKNGIHLLGQNTFQERFHVCLMDEVKRLQDEFYEKHMKNINLLNREDIGHLDIDFSKVEAMSKRQVTGRSVEAIDPEKAKAAFAYQEKILAIVKKTGELIWELGRILSPFKEQKMYHDLGYDTFAEWYQNIGLSKSSVYRAITIYETYVKKLGVSEDDVYAGDVRKLDRIATLRNFKVDGQPLLNQGNVKEWLGKAHELSESDLIKEVNAAKGLHTEEMVDGLGQGLYRLVPAKESSDNLESVSEKKVRVDVLKNGSDFFIRVF